MGLVTNVTNEKNGFMVIGSWKKNLKDVQNCHGKKIS